MNSTALITPRTGLNGNMRTQHATLTLHAEPRMARQSHGLPDTVLTVFICPMLVKGGRRSLAINHPGTMLTTMPHKT
jgi:hypothetical protein